MTSIQTELFPVSVIVRIAFILSLHRTAAQTSGSSIREISEEEAAAKLPALATVLPFVSTLFPVFLTTPDNSAVYV